MKLLKERCRECSICAMFFSSSLTVSINALFLSRILSAILIRELVPHIVFNFSDKLYAIKKKVLKQSLTNISFVSHSFPLMFSRNSPCFNGSRSSTFPGVNMKLRTSPLSLIIRCNLNPKNHPIEHFHARQVPQMSYE